MEQNTANIIQLIAEIQIEALKKLKTEQVQEFSEDELCKLLQVKPEEIIRKKLEKTKKKYPVERAKGKSTKYNKL